MFPIIWVSLCLALPVSMVESKNVVFMPFLVTSHTRAFCMVAQTMTELGHNTWCGLSAAVENRKKIHADVFPGVTTFNYLDIIDLNEEELISATEHSAMTIKEDGRPDTDWIFEFENIMANLSFRAMKDGKMIEFIRSLKPDFLVFDFYPRVNEFVALSYILDVPFAIFSPMMDYTTAGIPFNPMAEMYNLQYFRTQATLYEQLNMLYQLWWPMFHDTFFDYGYIAQLAPTKPRITTNELMRRAEVFIIENDHFIDYPRPGLPNFKYIGVISSRPAQALVEPFKSFVERAEKSGTGIAVMSFGTLFMHFSSEIETKLITVLQQLNLHFVWRANITSPNPDKILTSTWIPQNDLLGHKNTQIFISHCGIHSQAEALYHAVPLVCLPLFFDQEANMERTVQKGYGLGLSILTASVQEIVNLVENVTNNQEIRSTVKIASEIYHILYKNPRKEAAFWLDHVMKYGGSYMRYSGQTMPMYQLMLPEFLMFVAGVVFGLFFVFFVLLLRCLCGCFRKQSRHLKKD